MNTIVPLHLEKRNGIVQLRYCDVFKVYVLNYQSLMTFDWDKHGTHARDGNEQSFDTLQDVDKALTSVFPPSEFLIHIYRSKNGFKGFCTSHSCEYSKTYKLAEAAGSDRFVRAAYSSDVLGLWSCRVSKKTDDDFIMEYIGSYGNGPEMPELRATLDTLLLVASFFSNKKASHQILDLKIHND